MTMNNNIMEAYLNSVYKDSIIYYWTFFKVKNNECFLIVKGNYKSKYKVYIKKGYTDDDGNENILYLKQFNDMDDAHNYYKECQNSLENFIGKKIL